MSEMNEAWNHWEQETISHVFGITLDEREAASSSLVHVPELQEELLAEKQSDSQSAVVATLDMADRILIARLSLPDAPQTSWDYILQAWIRCRHEEQRLQSHAPPLAFLPEALRALQHVRGLLISYAGLLLDMPDMFPRCEKHGDMLGPHALSPTLLNLAAVHDDTPLPAVCEWMAVPPSLAPVFLDELIARFSQDDSLDPVLGRAMRALTQYILKPPGTSSAAASTSARSPQASSSSPLTGTASAASAATSTSTQNADLNDVQSVLAQMLGLPDPRAHGSSQFAPAMPAPEGMSIAQLDWQPIQMAVVAAVEHKTLAAAMPFFSFFAPTTSAPNMERESILGPLLRLSCFADAFPSIARDSFSHARSRSPLELENSMSSLRMSLRAVQASNFRIFNALVRAGAEPRERVLAYWGDICQLNAKRGAMQVRAREVATDAFMVNVLDVLLRFAEPFAEPTCSKIDRIDATYLRRQKRWDTSSLTRILASETEGMQWMADTPETERKNVPNFVTDVFFITTRLMNVALGKALRRVEHREKEMDRLQKRIDELESEQSMWQGMPHASTVEQILQRARTQSDKLYSEVLAAQTLLMEPEFVQRTLTFVSFTMAWLVRLADPRNLHPHTTVQLPLPQEVPNVFRMLPEHVFEDACDTVLFYSRRKPDVLDAPARESITTFCTVFLSSGWFIRNPFLKAKLAEMLSYNVMPYGALSMGVLGDTINNQPLAIAHLVPAVMSFWIQAESTGSNTQFYDKFNIRYHLAQVFKAIWDNVDHKRQLHAQAQDHQSEFVVFINRLMNDVTFLLDDALDKLTELHAKQGEMDDVESWQRRPIHERQEFEGIVRTIKAQIRSDLGLGHEFLRLLIMFTKETSASFMMPEIVDRLAAMLDYNLDVLVGPRCQGLKVKDPKAVGFDPRSLLSEILSVILNLAPHEAFAVAVAHDGRSYSRETFSKAASISQRHMLKSPVDIDALAQLVDRVEKIKEREAMEEEDLGEVPDDFLDPLLATIMRDPVRLPTSRAVVDRSTIKAHLLSDGTDPFNRMPLTLDEVTPADDVREQIESWIQERRRQASS